ncbi:MAG: DUF6160 family protein [Acinetobacter pseudolwoffii]
MKKFTKLVLATSVAFSANAMAMQAMDDASLSETTGQDGISIGIGISKIEIEKLFIHDNDGLASTATLAGFNYGRIPAVLDEDGNVTTPERPAGTVAATELKGSGQAGAIVIQGNGTAGHKNEKHGVVIGANYDDNFAYLLDSRNLADLTIDSDGSADGSNPFINIAAKVSGLDISIGKIGVTASGVKNVGTNQNTIRRGGGAVVKDILSGLEIKTGVMDANIQLGSAPQGAMIKLNTKMVGGLEIKNLGILDNSSVGKPVGVAGTTAVTTREAGEIFVESIKIADANTKDLSISQDISIYNDAYVGTTGNTLGKAAHIRIVSNDTGAKDQYIQGIHLGSRTAASIGDMEVQGLQTYYGSPQFGSNYTKGAIITISGH